ncbi:unnamed protein product, partial [Citrullus colocynthis]
STPEWYGLASNFEFEVDVDLMVMKPFYPIYVHYEGHARVLWLELRFQVRG